MSAVICSFTLSIVVPFAPSFVFSNSPPLIATVTVTPTSIRITIIVIINAINVIPFFVFHLFSSFIYFANWILLGVFYDELRVAQECDPYSVQ